jgi:quinoprotein glucose dehydrogenase
LVDNQAAVRAEALRVLAKTDMTKVVESAGRVLKSGSIIEQQTTIELIAQAKSSEAEKLLAGAVDMLAGGKLPAELHLDLITAVQQSSSQNLREKLAHTQHGTADDPLSPFRPALAGGDAGRGEKIFFERSELSCVRCHKIGVTGGDVGPELTKVAADKQREYLLESLVDPNRQIAKGFDSVTLLLDDGRVVSGVLRAEDTTSLRIVTPEGQSMTIPRDTIEDRATGKSAMPEDIVKKLTKHEIRDLVEYLSTLK